MDPKVRLLNVLTLALKSVSVGFSYSVLEKEKDIAVGLKPKTESAQKNWRRISSTFMKL